MIHLLNLTCRRDWDLRNLMLKTYSKYSGFTSWSSINTDEDHKDYQNGAGWQASMIKLGEMRKMVNLYPVKDDDFILSVDSDVVFTSSEVFKYANSEYGLIGIQHQQPYDTRFGKWGHMSGALIFIRGDVAKKMCALSEVELNVVRFNHFKPFNITENEDVVLSYLAKFMTGSLHGGTRDFDLGSVPGLSSGDFENDIAKLAIEEGMIKGFYVGTQSMKSFYHLNYCPTSFLGEIITGKWDIPRILQMKGIEL